MNTSKYLTLCLGIALATTLAMSACGDDDGGGNLPQVDCATANIPTFANVAAFASCTSCHSSTLDGTARSGAPAGINYDNFADAMAESQRAVSEVFAGTMPPLGGVAEADKQDLYAWALCGTPQ